MLVGQWGRVKNLIGERDMTFCFFCFLCLFIENIGGVMSEKKTVL